jgi:hypothetical protein
MEMASQMEQKLPTSRIVPAINEYTPYSEGTSTRVNMGTATKEVRDDHIVATRYHTESRPISSICRLKPQSRFRRRLHSRAQLA